MRQSSLLLTLVSLVATYDLVGSWAQQGGQGALTFQFARSADSLGAVTSKLFVYDCFLAQFLFEAEEDALSLSFQTSTLLTQDCPLAALNNLRNTAQKITGFEIAFDQLRLLTLSGEAVFELVRQKYDYPKVLSGVWAMSMDGSAAVNPLRINGSLFSLCADQAQLSYSLVTINGSYPRLSLVLTQPAPTCQDNTFISTLQSATFLRIAQNLTQVVLLDGRGKYLMTLDKITTLSPTQPLFTATKQPPPPSVTKPYNQLVREQPTVTPTAPQQQASPNVPTASPTQQTNTFTEQTNIATQNSQTITQSNTITQQSNTIPQQSSSTIQQPVLQQQTTANAPQTVRNNVQSYSSNQIVSSQQPPQSATSSFSFVFDQNYAFGGSFSSSSLFSFDPNPIQTDPQQDITTTQYTSNTLMSTQDTKNTVINSQDVSTNSGTNTQNAETSQQDSTFIPDSISAFAQYTPSAQETPQPSQENTIMSNAPSGMGVAELISQSMSGRSSVSLWDTIQGSKWLLVWLNGVNNLQQFSRVYIMFTSTRMVLYCPCNTYYATYQLKGNVLKAEGWKGTNNRCDVNNDRRVTDYIFYANMLRLKGQNIAFYYNSQAQLAEFKPYY